MKPQAPDQEKDFFLHFMFGGGLSAFMNLSFVWLGFPV
jgi:hypothetical protein